MPLDGRDYDGVDTKPLTSARPTPEEELEDMLDLRVRMAALDEEQTMFDTDTAPKPPHPKEEGITTRDGSALVDMQADTPLVDDVEPIDMSLPDLGGDDLL